MCRLYNRDSQPKRPMKSDNVLATIDYPFFHKHYTYQKNTNNLHYSDYFVTVSIQNNTNCGKKISCNHKLPSSYNCL